MPTRCGFWDKGEDLREKLAASVALPSPFLALLLAACGGGGGGASGGGLNLDGGTVPVSGWAYDGPVSNARVYVDANNNKRLDAGDLLIGRTNTDGFYSGDIPTEHQGKLLFVNLTGAMDQGDPDVIGDERSTQGVWSAHAGSRVISPLTELMVATGRTSTEMATALGLPETINITQYNPFNSSNRTKDDILVIAAGVATAERLKEDNVDHEAVLSAVGISISTLSAAYDDVERSSSDNAEEKFNALRTVLNNTYGNSIMDDKNKDITDDVTLGILNGLSAKIALRAGAEASLPNSPVAVSEGANTTTKLATITVTKAPILGLGFEFVISGNGSEIFEARQDENGDNWGIYLRQGQELDYETAQVFTYTLGITLHIVNGTTQVGTPQLLGNLTLNLTNEDELDASVSISHAGSVASLEIGSVLTATVTPDVDAPDGEYAIVWVTGDGSAATGASYTLQDSDIGEELIARTTYTDPANNEEVTREARITPGTPSVAITSGGEGSSIAENSNVNEAGTVYTATAEASGAVTWSLEGADAQYFEIDDAGVVTFKQDGRSFNYEATSSLSFTVKASLTHQGSTSASKQVTIPITNVDEQDASVSISHAGSVASLEIGSVLTATVTPDVDAPDGEYAIVWVTGDGSAATGASYTLQDSDIGNEELICQNDLYRPRQ